MKKTTIKLTKEQRAGFEHFMALCDKYKNSWFWGDNGNASRRNFIEKRDCMTFETVVNGTTYYVSFSVSLSRTNVYVQKYVTKDGKQTTARVIRTLLEKDTSNVA